MYPDSNVLITNSNSNSNSNTTNDTENDDTNSNSTNELNYLALGDSYTIGQGVELNESFPVQLVSQLNNLGYNYLQPTIIARTGWTTEQLLNAIDTENIQNKFDLVTLLIGVNNQFQNRSITEFRTQFIELLNKAIELADNNPNNVIVISIPDWSVSPFGSNYDQEKISDEINQFNSVKKTETEIKEVLFINITDISRLAQNNSNYIANDQLHFSGLMHERWVNEIISKYF